MTKIFQPVWPWQGEQKTMNLIEKARNERRQTSGIEFCPCGYKGCELYDGNVYPGRVVKCPISHILFDPDWRAWLEKKDKVSVKDQDYPILYLNEQKLRELWNKNTDNGHLWLVIHL